MTNTMSYQGYHARIEYDDQDSIFFGRVAGIRDGVTFHAETVDDLRHAFHEAVDDYLETCVQIGKTPERAFSGKLMLRVDPEVHAKAVRAAELAGESLNTWGERALRQASNEHEN